LVNNVDDIGLVYLGLNQSSQLFHYITTSEIRLLLQVSPYLLIFLPQQPTDSW